MAYTKLPSGLTVPPESPGVEVAKKTIAQLSKKVKWTCAVVCRAFGSEKEISCGLKLGSAGSACGNEGGVTVSMIERCLFKACEMDVEREGKAEMRLKLDGPRHAAVKGGSTNPTQLCPHRTLIHTTVRAIRYWIFLAGKRREGV